MASMSCFGRLFERRQPGVGHVAIDHQIGAHAPVDRKNRKIGHARGRSLRPIRQGREIKRRAADRFDVEAERDRMAFADDTALDAERLTQADIQAVGEDHQPRRDLLAVRQHERLPLRTVGDRGSLCADGVDIRRNLPAHGVDERVVHHAVLVAGFPGDDVAKTRFPDLAVERGRAQGGVRKTGPAQQVELFSAELFAAQFGRVDGVRVDQDRGDAGPSQHRCRG